mmetsp:Transcript_23793/g.65999  ORF Transcript_23793/g.65999 Transcript_23793/m.65999 type:complete len:349 (+) Transcript_23793:973-2019(+)
MPVTPPSSPLARAPMPDARPPVSVVGLALALPDSCPAACELSAITSTRLNAEEKPDIEVSVHPERWARKEALPAPTPNRKPEADRDSRPARGIARRSWRPDDTDDNSPVGLNSSSREPTMRGALSIVSASRWALSALTYTAGRYIASLRRIADSWMGVLRVSTLTGRAALEPLRWRSTNISACANSNNSTRSLGDAIALAFSVNCWADRPQSGRASPDGALGLGCGGGAIKPPTASRRLTRRSSTVASMRGSCTPSRCTQTSCSSDPMLSPSGRSAASRAWSAVQRARDNCRGWSPTGGGRCRAEVQVMLNGEEGSCLGSWRVLSTTVPSWSPDSSFTASHPTAANSW